MNAISVECTYSEIVTLLNTAVFLFLILKATIRTLAGRSYREHQGPPEDFYHARLLYHIENKANSVVIDKSSRTHEILPWILYTKRKT